jgi:DNA-directed RNA polymerase specialized sigma24 family protein
LASRGFAQPDGGSLLELHHRLLDGDPTASAELADAVYVWLQRRLQASIPYASSDDVADVAADSVISYITDPRRYDPDRGKSVSGYLLMDARSDLLNLLEKRRRNEPPVQLTDAVADRLADGNTELMAKEGSLVHLPGQLEAIVAAALPNSADRRVLELMMERVRDTRSYVSVLGLQGLSQTKQAAEVKRAKDRIRARLRRAGIHP